MRHVPTLLRRELSAYFLSPMAYLILLAFQVIAFFDFWQLLIILTNPRNINEYSSLSDPLNVYVSSSTPFWIAILVAVPALTMRLLAEENRSGTIEGMLTTPITETELVIAKWLAGLVMYLFLLLPFAIYLPFLRYFGHYEYDVGPVIALGVGLTTMGMMFVAIGLFFSALTKHQVLAAIGTFAALFGVVLVTMVLYSLAVEQRSTWAPVMAFLAIWMQAHQFGYGMLDVRFLALHLSVAALVLYLTIKIVQFRRGV